MQLRIGEPGACLVSFYGLRKCPRMTRRSGKASTQSVSSRTKNSVFVEIKLFGDVLTARETRPSTDRDSSFTTRDVTVARPKARLSRPHSNKEGVERSVAADAG